MANTRIHKISTPPKIKKTCILNRIPKSGEKSCNRVFLYYNPKQTKRENVRLIKDDSMTQIGTFDRFINSEYLPKIKENPEYIKDIPSDIITREMCNAALEAGAGDYRICSWVFNNYPNFIDEKSCKIAVSHSPAYKVEEDDTCDIPGEGYGAVIYFDPVLKYVPKQYRTYDVCLAAVKHDERALQFVSPDMQVAHPDICVAADYDGLEFVSQNFWLAHPFVLFDGHYTLEYMSKENQNANPDIVKQLLAKYPYKYEQVSKTLRPKVIDVVKQTNDTSFVQHLSAAQQKKQLDSCIKYIGENPENLQHIKPDVQLLIADTCIKAVKSKPVVLKYLAPGLQNQCLDILESAATSDLDCFKCIQNDILSKNPQICIAAVMTWGEKALDYLKQKKLLTKDICETIAKEKPGFVALFPPIYRTEQMWNIAMDAEPYMVTKAPMGMRTHKRYMALMEDWCVCFENIPLSFRTNFELCNLAVGKWKENLKHVPSSVLIEHPEICYPILDQDPTDIYMVPKKVQQQKPELCQYALAKARFQKRYDFSETHADKHINNVMKSIDPIALKNNWNLINTDPDPIPEQWIQEGENFVQDIKNMFGPKRLR